MDIATLQQTDPIIIEDAASKRQRVREWLCTSSYDGLVISRRDQFAWVTSGGDNRVTNNSEVGFGHLVITANAQYVVAYFMDAARMAEEQLSGQGYQLVSLRWFDGDPRMRALELAGKRVAADTQLPGAIDVNDQLNILHYPLTNIEIERCRWLGKAVSETLERIAEQVHPGMTEIEIASRMHSDLIMQQIDADVVIVGSDERIYNYRHPLPTGKVLDKYLLIHPAARKWGLHANVSRLIYFGQLTEKIHKAYNFAASVEAKIFAEMRPGLHFAELLTLQKQWYAEGGSPLEWQNHFQGGPTGYPVVDTNRNQTDTVLQLNQAFDWFVTVTGAKCEELSLLTERGKEVASMTAIWPKLTVETGHGSVVVPDLWVR